MKHINITILNTVDLNRITGRSVLKQYPGKSDKLNKVV